MVYKTTKKKNKKDTTQFVLDTANNVNKTCVLLQTSGGKDEPNIVFMWTSQHETQNVKTHYRTTLKTIKMSDTDPTKNPGTKESTPPRNFFRG